MIINNKEALPTLCFTTWGLRVKQCFFVISLLGFPTQYHLSLVVTSTVALSGVSQEPITRVKRSASKAYIHFLLAYPTDGGLFFLLSVEAILDTSYRTFLFTENDVVTVLKSYSLSPISSCINCVSGSRDSRCWFDQECVSSKFLALEGEANSACRVKAKTV